MPSHIDFTDPTSMKSYIQNSQEEKDKKIHGEIESIEINIRRMRKEEYFHVAAVFATFETENEQRQVLNKLSTGFLVVLGLKKPAPSLPLFRDMTVLQVKEPNEPSSIRWVDLGVPFKVNTSPTFYVNDWLLILLLLLIVHFI